MKFFGWMQKKFDGAHEKRKTNIVQTTNHRNQEARKEEFEDWPNSLLAIGTFGNTSTDLKEQNAERPQQVHEDDLKQNSSQDLAEFTPEEIVKLQKELKKILFRKSTNKSELGEISNGDLPLDKFLNCPSSLEVDRRISSRFSTNSSDNYDYDEEEIDRTIRVIIRRCKDVCKEKKKKAIGKKSISFLLKKMFSGFAPTPSLRHTLPESRMEKLLRTLLSKKINAQKAPRASSAKKYLKNRHTSRKEDDEEKKREKTCDGSKWVKTDSEYIVLEI